MFSICNFVMLNSCGALESVQKVLLHTIAYVYVVLSSAAVVRPGNWVECDQYCQDNITISLTNQL